MNRRRTKTASHWPAAGREPIRKRVVLFFLFFFCCLFWRLAFGCWISGRNTVADNAPLNAAPLTAAHLHRIELSRLLLLFFLARFYRVFARSFFAGCCCCGGGGGCRCCLLSGSWPTALFGTESNSIQRNHRNWIRGDRPMSDTWTVAQSGVELFLCPFDSICRVASVGSRPVRLVFSDAFDASNLGAPVPRSVLSVSFLFCCCCCCCCCCFDLFGDCAWLFHLFSLTVGRNRSIRLGKWAATPRPFQSFYNLTQPNLT